ncbi:sugar-binding transcriptional regulator [Clostridium sp. SYSU_GA19001]|uniref:sugar-binding transcriptional regulator n=1 Tax=Clostridium caldaquaticum TaxID=2940653 RepID=UPI00207780E4|nr:sugar-binding domain-containing protein [Clostridium caldaquaticum]MCM8711819.1 sugar-binding transcriptional regulator [Clostridium caldaquaticum]
MHDILKSAQKIVPEILELLQKRYNILRTIYYNQPIGRRILANSLELGERIVRTEINFLKNQNLIDINTAGMSLTDEGEEVVEKLKDFIHELKGLSEIEEYIKKELCLKKVIVVPGDVDNDKTVLSELGKAASAFVKELIKDNSIIALTGGSTIKAVIDSVPRISNLKNVLVVPARGGMGRSVELQANNLAANLAQKLGAYYKLLHVPDNLSSTALNAILNENDVKEIVDNIKNSDIIIYGIGRAEVMAARRGLTEEKIEELKRKGAVGEAFGYYFNEAGEIIFSASTIMVDTAALKNVNNLVAVAAGSSKAESIVAAARNIKNTVLITDEGAAKEIINIIDKKG